MKRFLFFLPLIFPFLALAQSNFQEGYIVTNNKDTLKGYIDYKERRINATSVIFKIQQAAQPQVYNLKNAAAYGINGMEYFERFLVKISMSTVSTANLSVGLDSTSRVDTVFLKVLNQGRNATLYSYNDGIKERFYIKDRDQAVPEELMMDLYLAQDNNSTIISGTRYLRQLSQLRRKYLSQMTVNDERKLALVKYKGSDLIKVVDEINGQTSAKTEKKSSGVRLFAGTGLNISNAFYTGDYVLSGEGTQSKISALPYLTTGIDIFANPNIQKLVFRVELSLFMNKYEVSRKTSMTALSAMTHSFDQYGVAFNPQIIYNIYNTERLKVFAGAGAAIYFSKFRNNVTTTTNSTFTPAYVNVREDYIDFQSYSVAVPVTAGVLLNKKIEIAASYAYKATLTDYVYYGVAVRRFKVGLNYMFGKS